jgi:beta-lactamase regulating signal transducer with metallopeptidase domain
MFALRGFAISLSCFVLLYCLVSALVATTWHPVKSLRVAQQSVATLLFALRVMPLLVSTVITFALVVPSFQLLQPRSINMGLGTVPLALGFCALALIFLSCFRVIASQTRTTRVAARWLDGARPLETQPDAAVTFQSRAKTPPLTLVGICHPRVLVSESTVALLSENELRLALRHEVEHMKSHDNLKKLILRCCPFPGLAKLEHAWAQSAELAADDGAVSSQSDALDLAAALVKLSRLVRVVETAPVHTMGFVAGSLSLRVARLLAWDEASKSRRVRIRTWFVIPPAVAISLLVTIAYGPVLGLTHEITAWLLR